MDSLPILRLRFVLIKSAFEKGTIESHHFGRIDTESILAKTSITHVVNRSGNLVLKPSGQTLSCLRIHRLILSPLKERCRLSLHLVISYIDSSVIFSCDYFFSTAWNITSVAFADI